MAEKPPIFVVNDRRKFTAEGEIREGYVAPEPEPTPAPAPVAAVPETPASASAQGTTPASSATAKIMTMPERNRSTVEADDLGTDAGESGLQASDAAAYSTAGYDVESAGDGAEDDFGPEGEIGPPPTAAETTAQNDAYQRATRQIDVLMAQANPGMKTPAAVGFEHIVQSFYLSAIMAMGAGTEPGQKPRIDIVGARQSIDMLEVLENKTRGNLDEKELRLVQGIRFELRMMFLELTSAIGKPAPQAPPPFGRK